MSSNTARCLALVGLGSRTMRKILPGLLALHDKVLIVAACDCDQSKLDSFHSTLPSASLFPSIEALLTWHATEQVVDVAYIALPHHAYESVVTAVLTHGIHVLKEKPGAVSLDELYRLVQVSQDAGVCLGIAGHRRFSEQMRRLKEGMALVGRVVSCEITRKIVVENLEEGWRAHRDLAGGGVVIDLGWHSFDLLEILFGRPHNCNSQPRIKSVALLKTRLNTAYDVEDTAHLALAYPASDSQSHEIHCNVILSRIGMEPIDRVVITGELGVLTAIDGKVNFNTHRTNHVTNLSDPPHACWETTHSNADIIAKMFISFLEYCDGRTSVFWDMEHEVRVTKLISEVYSPTDTPQSSTRNHMKPDFEWPVITQDIEDTVLAQLHTSISVYDQGGVLGEFEDAFKRFHNHPEWFALLHNSGTNALHAMFLACGAKPGDEMIFPVYTFHATCSPAMQLGITPVFCDCKADGTIDPLAIVKCITPATRAVVVSHMWGIPCDMEAIIATLSQSTNRHIYLLEDCSHAHGAMIGGQQVGTFGDAAAWSLQGQKIVTGGEGGIVLTKHADWHYAQLIHGHYNKRCKTEIPATHPLREFFLTGAGLKNRAHPLAIAIALNQLTKLPRILTTKRRFAAFMAIRLGKIPFLKVPDVQLLESRGIFPAWYAFVVHFDTASAPPDLTRNSFVEALHREGLLEVDIPRSTGLLHKEPLFVKPWVILPHLYTEGRYLRPSQEEAALRFPSAQDFYDTAIKLPVWGYNCDQKMVERYVEGVSAVAWKFLSQY